MAPKKKKGGQPAPAAVNGGGSVGAANGSAVTAAGTSSAPSAAAKEAAAKEAEKIFKQFKKKSDAKLLLKLKAAVEAGPSTASHMMLAKAHIMQAFELTMKKGVPPPRGDASRMAEVAGPAREQAEAALEGEVVGELMAALEQAHAGVSADGKDKSLRCLVLAALLAVMMRARGSPEEIVQRLQIEERLLRFISVAQKLESLRSPSGAGGMPWLPATAEGPPPRWHFEEERAGVPPVVRVNQASLFLREAHAADTHAAQMGRAMYLPLSSDSLGAPEETGRRLQERLTSWPVLPREQRAALGRKYGHPRIGGAQEREEAEAAGGREGQRVASRDDKQKLGTKEAKQEQLSKAGEKQAREQRKKKEEEQARAVEAAAAAAKRQAERAAVVGEELARRVAAAGEGQESQLAALVGSLRMKVADMKQEAQRLAREKECTDTEAAILRAVLERLPSEQQHQQWIYCWGPDTASVLASESCGGPGQAAVLAAAASGVSIDADAERCRQRLWAAVECRGHDAARLVEHSVSSQDIPALACLQHMFSLNNAELKPIDFSIQAEHLPQELLAPKVADEDLRLLVGLAGDEQQRQEALASVYKRSGDSFRYRLIAGSQSQPTAAEGEAGGEAGPVAAAAAPAAAEQGAAEQPPAAAAAADGDAAAAAGAAGAAGPPAEGAAGQAAVPELCLDGLPLYLTNLSQLGDYMSNTWGSGTGAVEALVRVKPLAGTEVDAMLEPSYSHLQDLINLLASYVQGLQLAEMLEAAEKGSTPEGWDWWQYRQLALATPATFRHDPMARLGALQPDRRKLVAMGETMDGFTRWLLTMHRRMDRWLMNPPPPPSGGDEQQQQVQAGGSGAAQQPCSSDGGGSADGAGTGAAGEANSGSGEGSGSDQGDQAGAVDEIEEYQSASVITEVLVDWLLRGLAATHLATVDVPADVLADMEAAAATAAAAAHVSAAAAAASSGPDGAAEAEADGKAVAGGEAAAGGATATAWLLDHKACTARRIMLLLRTLQREAALPEMLLQSVVDYILLYVVPDDAEAPNNGTAAGTEQQQEKQQQGSAAEPGSSVEADGAAGPDAPQQPQRVYNYGEVLALLPRMPLHGLHTLLVFTCIQFNWRAPTLQCVSDALKPGDEGMMAALLELRSSGKGGKEAAFTPEGLQWLLAFHSHPDAPFPPTHFEIESAEAADMAAQLAALVLPMDAEAWAKATVSAQAGACASGGASSSEAPDQDGAAGPAGKGKQVEPRGKEEQQAGGAAQQQAGVETEDQQPQDEGAGEDQQEERVGKRQPLPPVLRLAEEAARWQPPASLAARLRLQAAVQGSASEGSRMPTLRQPAPATVDPYTTELGAVASTARLALYFGHLLQVVVAHSSQTFHKLEEDFEELSPHLQDLHAKLSTAEGPLLPRLLRSNDLEVCKALVQYINIAEQCQGVLDLLYAAVHSRSMADGRDNAERTRVALLRVLEAPGTSAETRRRAEEAVKTQEQNVKYFQSQLDQQQQLVADHQERTARLQRKESASSIQPAVQELNQALELIARSRPVVGSAAAQAHAREVVNQARQNALAQLDYLEATLQDLLNSMDHTIQWAGTISALLCMKLRECVGLLQTSCRVHVRRHAAEQLVSNLLPAAWEAEHSGAKAADDAQVLLLEEEKERERQRQAEAERREAERKAKAKKAKKAAAAAAAGGGFGGGKGAARGDWRDEVADVAAGEADGVGEEDEDEDEAKPLTEEQAAAVANLARLWEEAGEDPEEEDWQQAGAAARHKDPQHRQGARPGSAPAQGAGKPAVLTVPRSAPRPQRPEGSGPGTLLPRQRLQQPKLESAVDGEAAGGGGWSFDGADAGARQQQEGQAQQASWARRAQGGEGQGADDDVDSLLATMNIRSPRPAAPAAGAAAGAGEGEEEDDPDLAAAIAASLAPAGPPSLAGPYAASSASGGGDTQQQASNGVEAGVEGAVGLRNLSGEYNCFLNVIVQCLWRCREFRQQVACWGPQFVASDAVVSALHALFQAFQQQKEEEQQEKEQQAHQQPQEQPQERAEPGAEAAAAAATAPEPSSRGGGGENGATDPSQPPSAPPSPAQTSRSGQPRAWGSAGPLKPISWAAAAGAAANGDIPTGRERKPIDPSPLREALAALPGHSFKQGEMHDPAEVLLCVYEKIIQVYQEQESAPQAGQPSELQQTFGLAVKEQVDCPACGKTTHQNSYEQFFYTTQATGLRYLCKSLPSPSMGQLLRELEAQHQKSCDKDVGGCRLRSSVNHFLERAPRVFTLQLTWESHSEQPEDIAATLTAIDEEVDLGEVYQGAERGAHRYRLRSMVCYYGQHYQALVLVPDAGGWLMFDDTRVTRVGGWPDVRRKCEAGRIQPSVLFYEAVA